mmetsp:Transcript_5967/g.7345  ORF Transcript_5967/g.7345 Transcript_5967/m.7345 type:complete len:299 (-) Transcript_5967:2059-2955(-)
MLIKVLLLTGELEELVVDVGQPWELVVRACCETLDIDFPEEFWMYILNGGSTVSRTSLTPVGETVSERAHLVSTYVLKRRLFLTSPDISDAQRSSWMYNQCVSMIREGLLLFLKKDDAILAAAMQCRITHGPYNANTKIPSQTILSCLPLRYRKKKMIGKVEKAYRKLWNNQEENLKMRFVNFCVNLPTYGIVWFPVTMKDPTNPRKRTSTQCGIGEAGIYLLNKNCSDMNLEYPLEQLKRWAPSKNNILLDLGDYASEYVDLETPYPTDMSEYLNLLVETLVKRRDSINSKTKSARK